MRRWTFAALAILLWVSSLFAGPKQQWTGWSRTPRAFMPYDVPETVAWFSSRHRVTDVSGAASQWDTLVGSFSATQATSGKRPAIGTQFNGSSLDFTAASTQELTNLSVNLLAPGATRYVLIVAKASNSTGGALLFFNGDLVPGKGWILYVYNTGSRQYFSCITSSSFEAEAGAPDFTQPFLIEYELTMGATPVVRVNGVSRTVSGTVNDNGTGTTGFRIGSSSFAGQYWPGSISDIYIASGIPSSADNAKLRTYYSLVNKLPVLL